MILGHRFVHVPEEVLAFRAVSRESPGEPVVDSGQFDRGLLLPGSVPYTPNK